MAEVWRFEVRKGQLSETRWRHEPQRALAEGQARLRVSLFSFTANNVTYALMGEGMGYWDFFPAAEGWGIIPVWGFADVVETRSDGARVGERIYGYLPMSGEVVVDVARADETGFVDAAPHRAARAPAYNQYARTATDALHDPAREGQQALFRPLFTTSFALDHYLRAAECFGAAQIVMSSASSKTALSTAFMLARAPGPRPKLVALTSPANKDFVARLGVYDEIALYGEMDGLDAGAATVFLDFAGDGAVRAAAHAHFTRLTQSVIIGATHWAAAGGPPSPGGVRPSVFFAPDQIRLAIKDWGAGAYRERLGAASAEFMRFADGWLAIATARDRVGAETVYRDTLGGRTPAHVGHIIAIQD
jgi:hypothetical protein